MANPWPTGQDSWHAYAARCVAFYPDLGTDWDKHAGMMRARRNAALMAAQDYVEDLDLNDEPLNLEEEEAALAAVEDQQVTLF